MSAHARNTVPMQAAPRCGAVTARGTPCGAPRARGSTLCRWHGGGSRAGAPPGNENALRHGRYSAAARWRRHRLALRARHCVRTRTLLAALAVPPVLPPKARLPDLAALARAPGVLDGRTIATGPGIGATVWHDGRGPRAAFHRLTPEATLCLGDGVQTVRTLLAVAGLPAPGPENNTVAPDPSEAPAGPPETPRNRGTFTIHGAKVRNAHSPAGNNTVGEAPSPVTESPRTAPPIGPAAAAAIRRASRRLIRRKAAFRNPRSLSLAAALAHGTVDTTALLRKLTGCG